MWYKIYFFMINIKFHPTFLKIAPRRAQYDWVRPLKLEYQFTVKNGNKSGQKRPK